MSGAALAFFSSREAKLSSWTNACLGGKRLRRVQRLSAFAARLCLCSPAARNKSLRCGMTLVAIDGDRSIVGNTQPTRDFRGTYHVYACSISGESCSVYVCTYVDVRSVHLNMPGALANQRKTTERTPLSVNDHSVQEMCTMRRTLWDELQRASSFSSSGMAWTGIHSRIACAALVGPRARVRHHC